MLFCFISNLIPYTDTSGYCDKVIIMRLLINQSLAALRLRAVQSTFINRIQLFNRNVGFREYKRYNRFNFNCPLAIIKEA